MNMENNTVNIQCAQDIRVPNELGSFDWVQIASEDSRALLSSSKVYLEEKNKINKEARTWASWKPWNGLAPEHALKL